MTSRKYGTKLLGDETDLSTHEAIQRLHQGGNRAVELEDLALELVDALGGIRPAFRENLGLDAPDVLLQRSDHGAVVVHHPVEDRVERRLRAVAKEIRPLLELHPDVVQLGLSVTNRDDEPVADEDLDLAELDLVTLAPRSAPS